MSSRLFLSLLHVYPGNTGVQMTNETVPYSIQGTYPESLLISKRDMF